jgi:hypothetical protein
VLGTRSHTSVAAIIFATSAGMRYPRRKNRPLSFACGSPEVKQPEAHAAAVEFISGAHRNPTTL